MKKIFTLALAAVAALSVSAADLTPGYIVGEIAPLAGTDKDTWAAGGDQNGWKPATPLEIAQTSEGVYEGEFWCAGYFAFSTAYGDWDTFNADRWYSDVQLLVSGKPSAINYGGEGPGAWNIAKVADAVAISIKVDLVNEEVTVVNLSEGEVEESKEPALTGYITSIGLSWSPIPFSKTDAGWELSYPDGLVLDPTTDMIKICGADGKWNNVNFGGSEAIALDTEYTLVRGGNDIVIAEAMTVKSILLVMSEDLTTATLTLKSTDAAINDIVVDSNEAVEYYNLQGVKVSADELPAGLYIAKQGAKTSKVLVK